MTTNLRLPNISSSSLGLSQENNFSPIESSSIQTRSIIHQYMITFPNIEVIAVRMVSISQKDYCIDLARTQEEELISC